MQYPKLACLESFMTVNQKLGTLCQVPENKIVLCLLMLSICCKCKLTCTRSTAYTLLLVTEYRERAVLKKAFDTTDHDTLLVNLSRFGVLENELKWFSSYLSGRKQSCYSRISIHAFRSSLKKFSPPKMFRHSLLPSQQTRHYH